MCQAAPQEGTPVIPAPRPSFRAAFPLSFVTSSLLFQKAQAAHPTPRSLFQSIAQFIEWRLRRAGRDRGRAAAGAARRRYSAARATRRWCAGRRAARRYGTASGAVAAGIRADDDVAEISGHFLDAEHAGGWRLRRCGRAAGRSAWGDRRLGLTILCRHLRRGGRCRQGSRQDDRQDQYRTQGRLVHDRARWPRDGNPTAPRFVPPVSACVRYPNVERAYRKSRFAPLPDQFEAHDECRESRLLIPPASCRIQSRAAPWRTRGRVCGGSSSIASR
jgi:hypothetical protein